MEMLPFLLCVVPVATESLACSLRAMVVWLGWEVGRWHRRQELKSKARVR